MISEVYFTKASESDGQFGLSEKARKLFKAGDFARCFQENDLTAVKIHVGEAGNTTYLKAPCIKGLVDELLALKTRPFLADSNTLYAGRRHNSVAHTILAAEHGFSLDKMGVPFIVTGGLTGTSETVVNIDGQVNKQVFIASDIVRCQSILSVAHFTGHCAACVGATLKTLGMGCASKKGKMKQHAALTLSIGDNCTACGECARHCPADAITLNDIKAHINQDKCISCAECLAVCKFDAVQYNWGTEGEILQKSIAEYAMGALKGKKNRAAFFNYVVSVTTDCDCMNIPNMRKIVDDIGIFAGTDPVAVDTASLDMIEANAGRKFSKLIKRSRLDPRYQIEHAQRIGLGTADYKIIEVA